MLSQLIDHTCSTRERWINSLWPGEAIWHHGSWSTMVQVMAWCLMAPSHNLKAYALAPDDPRPSAVGRSKTPYTVHGIGKENHVYICENEETIWHKRMAHCTRSQSYFLHSVALNSIFSTPSCEQSWKIGAFCHRQLSSDMQCNSTYWDLCYWGATNINNQISLIVMNFL